ncbi:MAG: NADH-quinone oxidoreductase subunit NuoF [Planctomycetota bacterium]
MNFDSIQRKANSAWQDFESPEHGRVLVGSGTCGRAAGAEDVLAAAREYDTDGLLDIYEVGCLGLCYAEPLVELSAPDMPAVLYGNLRPDQLPELLSGYFDGADLQSDNAVAVMNGEQVEGIPSFDDLPMMRAQKRIVLENCGVTDPDSIDHYVARGGYSGLRAALQSSPDDVINEIKESGLRGRGGAGFPTGLKWQFCRQEQSDTRYLVCNADEGDPGAFMDRSLIEGDPHRVIEGILIAAHAIGASQAYVYIRAEYPLAIDRLEAAAEQAREMGLLGEDVLGSDLSVELELKKGAGAFVCGEETALLASLEGKRGQPQPRPPFPAQDGFKGHPTNINNVETLANVPSILRNGSDWFRRYGTEESPGTKTFALAGKVARTGLIEVPLGTKLGDIVQGAGGGVAEGAELKGVQTGGPSGGCIPESMMDIPADYSDLARAGSIMGSGGMIVMDDATCMVDIAKYFIDFCQKESCGKCPPCRLGTAQMLTLLEKVSDGEAGEEDLELLDEMARAVADASLCGLGQTAPNPVLTTLQYFRDEYEAHLAGQCPAEVCDVSAEGRPNDV